MNTKIKLFGVGLVALAWLFASANFASAQTVTVTTCNSATISGTITSTSGVSTSAWFEWGTTVGFGNTTPAQVFSVPQGYTQVISGLTQNTLYYYRAVVSNIYGIAQGATLSFTTPSCTANNSVASVTTSNASSVAQNSATLNGFVTPNGTNTSAWFEWGTVPSYGNTTASVNYGTIATSFNNTVPNLIAGTTYYFRAVAQNSQGTVYGSQMSFVTTGTTASLPSITTSSASSVLQNGATLNGFVTPNGTNTSAWFEWGTTQSFGNTTPSTNYGTVSTNFNNSVFNLAVNTTYYFRAVAQNSQGTVYGSTLSFTTTGQNNNNYTQPYVSTNSASTITQNSATLNGYVTSSGTNTSAWFEWGTSYSLGNTTPSINYGTGPTSFNSPLFSLSANTTYYFRAVAQSSYGTVYGSVISFTTSGQSNNNNYSQPYVSTNSASSVLQNSATLNGYVTANGTNASAWFEWGTTQSFGNTTPSNNYGTGATSFSNSVFNLNPNTTYYFRAVAQSSYGTVYGSTLSFTTSGQTSNYSGSSPTVATLLATELTGTTAKLNGLVFTTANQSSNAWFEWGTTANLGNTTQSINVGALPTVKHSDFITGLAQGQTYYYRVVAENTYGRVYGSTNTFVSEVSTYVAPIVTTPVVLRPTTVVVTRGSSAQSLVSLSVEGGPEMITSGEKRTYHVAWKNESAQDLKNVVLRIVFPQSMNVDSATKGTFSSADNSVTIDLKNLATKENGETFIFATVGRGLKAGELLVVTANMVYTEANGAQGDAIAYVTHRADTAQSAIGANIFGAGDFMPTTIFGWIALLILVLVLVLLGNHLYGRFAGTTPGH